MVHDFLSEQSWSAWFDVMQWRSSSTLPRFQVVMHCWFVVILGGVGSLTSVWFQITHQLCRHGNDLMSCWIWNLTRFAHWSHKRHVFSSARTFSRHAWFGVMHDVSHARFTVLLGLESESNMISCHVDFQSLAVKHHLSSCPICSIQIPNHVRFAISHDFGSCRFRIRMIWRHVRFEVQHDFLSCSIWHCTRFHIMAICSHARFVVEHDFQSYKISSRG